MLSMNKWQDGWQEDYVETNGIRLHYWQTGGQKPPVVCLHGITDNGLCWRRVAQALQASYDLILVDGRGHGLSDKPEGEYVIDAYAADTAGLIEALNLGKLAVLGHSLGAAIATVLAAMRPDLVQCLVLEDPPWRLPGTPEEEAARRAHMQTWRAETRQRQVEMTHAELVEFGMKRSTTWHEDEFEPWADAKLQVSERVFEGVHASLQRWPDLVPHVVAPTLLIGGDPERGGIVSPEVARQVAALNPRVEFARIAGAGHNVRRERFGDYVARVEAFLAQHSA